MFLHNFMFLCVCILKLMNNESISDVAITLLKITPKKTISITMPTIKTIAVITTNTIARYFWLRDRQSAVFFADSNC